MIFKPTLVLAALLSAVALTGCGSAQPSAQATQQAVQTQQQEKDRAAQLAGQHNAIPTPVSKDARANNDRNSQLAAEHAAASGQR